MQKIDSLRAAIVEAVPELATDPTRLRIWIERGAARCPQTASESFAFRFQLNVLAVEMSTDIAVLALALFRWMRVNQPDLLIPGADGFTFDADILDNACADVLVQLEIDQRVAVADGAPGTSSLTYLPEPDPLFGDDLGFGGTDPAPPLVQVTALDDLPPWET